MNGWLQLIPALCNDTNTKATMDSLCSLSEESKDQKSRAKRRRQKVTGPFEGNNVNSCYWTPSRPLHQLSSFNSAHQFPSLAPMGPTGSGPIVTDRSNVVDIRTFSRPSICGLKSTTTMNPSLAATGGSANPERHWCSSPAAVRWSWSTSSAGDRWAALRSSVMLSLCLLSILQVQLTQGKIRSRDPGDPVGNIRHVLPELELGNNSVTDVRFNVGSTAFLPCRFPSFPRHHENRVSWVRRWDWHILTAGLFTYTNDDRFVVLHRDGTNDWTLQIKFLHTDDNGTYECQVHSGSGFMSQFVNLHVVTPRAVILEPVELTVKNGDNFLLTCIIQQSLEPPVYVMWLHGGVPVNYAPDRPRLNVQMEVKGSTSRSLLKVKDAKYTDSGNYTCTAPNAVNAWVLVYVTEGDTVAAVQRRHPDSAGGTSSSSSAGTLSSGASSSSAASPDAAAASSAEAAAAATAGSSAVAPSTAAATAAVTALSLGHVLVSSSFSSHHSDDVFLLKVAFGIFAALHVSVSHVMEEMLLVVAEAPKTLMAAHVQNTEQITQLTLIQKTTAMPQPPPLQLSLVLGNNDGPRRDTKIISHYLHEKKSMSSFPPETADSFVELAGGETINLVISSSDCSDCQLIDCAFGVLISR